MAADGSIIIEAKLDNKTLEKNLEDAKKEIKDFEKSLSDTQKKASAASKSQDLLYTKYEQEISKYSSLQEKLSGLQDAQSPLVKQVEEIRTKLEEAKQQVKMFEEQWKAGIIGADKEQTSAQENVRRLSEEYNNVLRKIEKMDPAIVKATSEVDAQKVKVDEAERAWNNAKHEARNLRMEVDEISNSLNKAKENAGEIQQKMAAIPPDGEKMAKAMEKAQKSAKRFGMRLKEVVRSALVFTLITQGLAMVRKWMGRVIKTNAEATAAIAKLKGALLTLAQPLLSVIIPAFTAFVNVLTKIVSVAAQLLSMLFGKTIEQSKDAAEGLHEETEALEGVGAAAEKASGSLAGFDEINTISTEKSGGGGAGSTEIAPNFDFGESIPEEKLKNLLGLVKAIAAGLLAWKLGNGFLDTMKKFLGILLAIDGAVGFARAAMDAWNNGLNWDNLLQILGRALELVLGLWLVFGKLGAGIGLVATGIGMLAVGFHDAFENGWNLQNTILSMAGLFATGLGIAVLTGSWIPALIGGIAAILLAITTAYGDGEALISGVREMLEGFKDFFVGVFTGDLTKAIGGISKIFGGLRTIVSTVVDAVKNMFNSFLDWLDEKTHGKLSGLIEWVRGFLNGHFEILKKMFDGFLEGIQLAFEGLVAFIAGVFTGDWEMAWEGVKDVFRGVWNGIVSIIEGAINFCINGINALIDGFNRVLSMGDKVAEFLFGTTLRVPKISEVSLPRLATGAVIPPNREFMAILGDQRSGNNIEAPEALIRKIVREEAGGMNTDLLQAILEAIRAGQVIKVNETVLGRTTAKAINKVTQSAGKAVLLY